MAKTPPGKPPEPPGKPKPDLAGVIHALAIEYATCKWCRACRCGHVQDAHLDGSGKCMQGCSCLVFQGMNLARQRQLERFGKDLADRLGVKL